MCTVWISTHRDIETHRRTCNTVSMNTGRAELLNRSQFSMCLSIKEPCQAFLLYEACSWMDKGGGGGPHAFFLPLVSTTWDRRRGFTLSTMSVPATGGKGSKNLRGVTDKGVLLLLCHILLPFLSRLCLRPSERLTGQPTVSLAWQRSNRLRYSW